MLPTPPNSIFKACWVLLAICSPLQGIAAVERSITEPPITEPPITAIALFDDPHQGQLIVAASSLGLRVLTSNGQRIVYSFTGTASLIHKIIVADNRMLVVGGEPGESAWGAVYQAQKRLPGEPLAFTSQPIAGLNQFDDCLFDAALSPDGTRALIVSLDGQARVQPLDVGNDERQTFRGHSAGVTGAVWLDLTTAATSSRDASIRVWNADTGLLVRTLSQHTGEVTHLRRSPNNNVFSSETRPLVASAGLDRTVRFWQPNIGRLVRFCKLDGQTCSSMTWTTHGEALVVGTTAGQLLWIDPQTTAVTRTAQVSADWVTAVAASESNTIFYGTADGKLGSKHGTIKAKLSK